MARCANHRPLGLRSLVAVAGIAVLLPARLLKHAWLPFRVTGPPASIPRSLAPRLDGLNSGCRAALLPRRSTAGERKQVQQTQSKSEMLKFAIPTLGIYIADPLMSSIDNAFVGRFGGTVALAALGPGTLLANNIVFLFANILNSATTGLVARAWSGGAEQARSELARTMNLAYVIGTVLSLLYLTSSSWALRQIGTSAELLQPAAQYVWIRGLVAWAVLAQGVGQCAILATRDAMTPLAVVAASAALNFLGDWCFCCWPLRAGSAGAAIATALSQLFGLGLMVRALKGKGILPKLQLPSWKDAGPVLEYAGPLFVVVTARVIGFSAMAISAARLGTVQLAAYQLILGVFVIFAFVSAPLSQIAQTTLPPLIDAGDSAGVRRAGRNIFILAAAVGTAVAGLSFLALYFGAFLFTSDPAVISQVRGATPAVFLATGTLLISSAVDGALLAAKDFGFVVPAQLAVCALQLFLLELGRRHGAGLFMIFLTFPLRLLTFVLLASSRIFLRRGPLGRVAREVSGS